MKSNSSATPIKATTAIRFVSIRSGVLHDDALEDVGDVLAAVRGLLEKIEDLLPLDDRDGVLLVLEEGLHGSLVGAGGFVLEAIDFDRAVGDALALFERLQRADDLLDRIAHQLGQLAGAGADVLDGVEPHDRRR